MNKTIKDLKDILKIHHLDSWIANPIYGIVVIDPKQVAEYIYGAGYRRYRKSGGYCKWKLNHDLHNTDCGKLKVFDYSLEELDYKYCMFCGRKIKVVKSK